MMLDQYQLFRNNARYNYKLISIVSLIVMSFKILRYQDCQEYYSIFVNNINFAKPLDFI